MADDPPPALVARLADVFGKTDGDLKALATALLDSDEAWKAPLTKMRSPYEFLVAAGRLLAQIPDDPGRYLGGLNVLGQPLWSPAGPNGFPDTNAAWAAPEGMKLRLDISAQIASRLADGVDPRDLLELVAARRRVARDAADHRARGIAAAGAGAVADVAGIPEEMTPMETKHGNDMDCCESLTSSVDFAPRAAARRRLVCGVGLFAEIRARRRRARSAAGGRHPARRAGWARHRRADRRSRLRRPAWFDRADIERAERGAGAGFLLRAASGDAGIRADVSREAGRGDSRGGDVYRDRSHFDGQDVLESGFAGPGRVQSGWLNRALEALPRGERVMSALAVGPTTPLVLRGAAPTVGWAPVALPQAADDTAMRLVELYQHRDPALADGADAEASRSTRPRKATT